MKNLIVVALILISLSCTERELITIETEILTPEKVLDEFGDGVFFTSISMTSDDKNIFVVSKNPASLFILDKNFTLQKLIERRGDGPDDLKYPTQLVKTKHGLMIEDLGSYKISILDPQSGDYLSEIKIPEPVSQWNFFFDGEESLYFSMKGHESDSSSVLKINTKGEVVGKFGFFMPQKQGDFNRQARMIQPFGSDKLMLIGINLPFIDILTSEGEKVATHRWDRFEPLKRALDSLEHDFNEPGIERNPKEIKHIIIDAQYVDGKLYVSFTDRIGMNRSKARHLLEFELTEKSLALQRVFRFETGTPDDNLHPNAFHVDKKAGKIYAQGLITKQIYVFDLPD
jgi:hypothetical protein